MSKRLIMKNKHWLALSLVLLALFALTPVVLASSGKAEPATTLVEAVRKATAGFKDAHDGGGGRLWSIPRLRQRAARRGDGPPLCQWRPGGRR